MSSEPAIHWSEAELTVIDNDASAQHTSSGTTRTKGQGSDAEETAASIYSSGEAKDGTIDNPSSPPWSPMGWMFDSPISVCADKSPKTQSPICYSPTLDELMEYAEDLPSSFPWPRLVSKAKEDWRWQKDNWKVSNAALDTLMCMTGLEAVKAKFLEISTFLEIRNRQSVRSTNETFGAAFIGNPGTGQYLLPRILNFKVEDVI